jgi:uncharacterized repeat protein (TIGR01451 family)
MPNGTVTGIINIRDMEITQDGQEFIYEITETKTPTGYAGLTSSFFIKVRTHRVGDEYKLRDVELVRPNGSGVYELAIVAGVKVGVSNDGNTIEIEVENEEIEEFDLSLRKFITDINGTAVTDRVPEIDIKALRDRTGTTANYIHPKNPVPVRHGDIVTYTIRVYNEGDIDGYVSEIRDNLPEGLGFLMNHKTNFENGWKIPSGANTINLVGEDGLYADVNRVKNLEVGDFNEITSLEDVKIVRGRAAITTSALKRDSLVPNANLIKAYDRDAKKADISSNDLWQETVETGFEDGLYYREVQITAIVLAPNSYQGVLRNIAEITEHTDGDGNNIVDRDSTPGNVDLNNYNPPDNNSSYQEDDDDYEQLVLKHFSLHLRKFITQIDEKEVTDRVPEVKQNPDGSLTFEHPKDPVHVANSQIVTYTIRVYNTGNSEGYVEEVKDNLPEGLLFLPEHETNKHYEWIMYYEEGDDLVETDDVEKATEVRTRYLSEASETAERQNEMRAYDPNKPISDVGPLNPDYRDVKITFKVVEEQVPENSDRIITNIASIPGTDKEDEEHVYVKYFKLQIIKWVSRAIVTIDGKVVTSEHEMPVDDPGSSYLVKVDIDRRDINRVVVEFVYTIKVINIGELEGYVTEITDIIPVGMIFRQEDNPLWSQGEGNTVTTRALENTLLLSGESATVDIKLRWQNGSDNLGVIRNIARITEYYNEYDAKDPGPHEDDATTIITVETGGIGAVVYVPVVGMVLTTLLGGVYFIKRYVLLG